MINITSSWKHGIYKEPLHRVIRLRRIPIKKCFINCKAQLSPSVIFFHRTDFGYTFHSGRHTPSAMGFLFLVTEFQLQALPFPLHFSRWMTFHWYATLMLWLISKHGESILSMGSKLLENHTPEARCVPAECSLFWMNEIFISCQ